MTELSFLLTLLFDHELPKDAQKAIRDRIKENEANPVQAHGYNPYPQQLRPAKTDQSPSTQRILDKMAAEGVISGTTFVPPPTQTAEPTPTAIAQTPGAVAALAARAEAIRIATSGVEEKGRKSPRKF
jgi:hypothetical protein